MSNTLSDNAVRQLNGIFPRVRTLESQLSRLGVSGPRTQELVFAELGAWDDDGGFAGAQVINGGDGGDDWATMADGRTWGDSTDDIGLIQAIGTDQTDFSGVHPLYQYSDGTDVFWGFVPPFTAADLNHPFKVTKTGEDEWTVGKGRETLEYDTEDLITIYWVNEVVVIDKTDEELFNGLDAGDIIYYEIYLDTQTDEWEADVYAGIFPPDDDPDGVKMYVPIAAILTGGAVSQLQYSDIQIWPRPGRVSVTKYDTGMDYLNGKIVGGDAINTIVLNPAADEGLQINVDVKNSIEIDSQELQLVNDEASPDDWSVYGSDDAANGWFTIDEFFKDTDTIIVTPPTGGATGQAEIDVDYQGSLDADSGGLQLKNDAVNPGAWAFYGTEDTGTHADKGWVDSTAVTVITDVQLDASNNLQVKTQEIRAFDLQTESDWATVSGWDTTDCS